MTAPDRAAVAIIGAGCVGAAIAWHLARRGVTDVVVVEREPYAGAGSTAKAAGGIRAQFSSPINVRISMLAASRPCPRSSAAARGRTAAARW